LCFYLKLYLLYKIVKFLYQFIKEFYIRFKFLLLIIFFYSFIISYYALDLLELIIFCLGHPFFLDFTLNSLEDFSKLLSSLEYVFLLIFLLPVFFLQLFLFFAPSFYVREIFKIRLLLFSFFLGYVFSFCFLFIIFIFFYVECFTPPPLIDSDVAISLVVDFKQMFLFYFAILKFLMFLFLPLNFCFAFFSSFCNSNFNLIKFNAFIFLFLYLLNVLPTENVVQFVLLFSIQLLQLQFFILINLILYSVRVKTSSISF
jgi:hypothetical protein